MKTIRWISAATIAALTIGAVCAQGAQPQGGAGQGPRFRMGGPRLLLNEAVQKELKMTKAQIEKAQKTFGTPGGPGAGGRQGGAGAGGGGRQGAIAGPGGGMTDAQREQLRLENEKKVKGILNANQFERYTQITLQMQGPSALLRKDVAAKVGLTAQQQAKIAEIAKKQSEKLRSMFQQGGQNRGAQGGQGANRREQFQKIREQTNEQILAVLTPAQRKAWTTMLGKPFTLPSGR